jgi:hypothetical protein
MFAVLLQHTPFYILFCGSTIKKRQTIRRLIEGSSSTSLMYTDKWNASYVDRNVVDSEAWSCRFQNDAARLMFVISRHITLGTVWPSGPGLFVLLVALWGLELIYFRGGINEVTASRAPCRNGVDSGGPS